MTDLNKKIPYDNFIVQGFAGELIGHHYPLSTEMTKKVFDGFGWTVEEFEKKLVAWMETE
jgi:hypothetical protein